MPKVKHTDLIFATLENDKGAVRPVLWRRGLEREGLGGAKVMERGSSNFRQDETSYRSKAFGFYKLRNVLQCYYN